MININLIREEDVKVLEEYMLTNKEEFEKLIKDIEESDKCTIETMMLEFLI